MSNGKDIVKVTENWLQESDLVEKTLEDIDAGKIKCEYNKNFKKTIIMNDKAIRLLDYIDDGKLYNDNLFLIELGYSKKYNSVIYFFDTHYADKFYPNRNKRD